MQKNIIRKFISSKQPILLEIGCAEGLDTLEFIKVFNDLPFKMFCFEPYRINIEKFKKNITDARVNLQEKAVGNVDGIVPFNISTGVNIYSSSLRDPGEALFETWPELFKKDTSFIKEEVPCVKLDSFAEEFKLDIIDFIWMDCQGAEDLIIQGGENTFSNKVKYLYTEYSNQEIYKGQRPLGQLLELLPDFTMELLYPNQTGDLKGGDILLSNKKFRR